MSAKPNKYRAVKTRSMDGVMRDSKAEADFVNKLLMLQKAGAIQNLRLQVPYELIPKQCINGKLVERPLGYIADAVYEENGKEIVADRKGMKTRDYIIKRKLMLHKFGIQIKEV